ncbi:MAG: helicase, partial [Proteiniphilum sp.]|nr:helicase [Proteiniphilum sp.]
EYIKIYGRIENERKYKWFKREYLSEPPTFKKYKIILPKANGSGAIGEVLSTPLIGEPLIGEPLIGFTETFISIGAFNNETEAENCLKYVKSKFSRTMLGVLKVTQDNPRDKWIKVPLQDFTPQSDIDWTKSIPEIDRQLYVKYGFDEKEIAFIEEKVKPME